MALQLPPPNDDNAQAGADQNSVDDLVSPDFVRCVPDFQTTPTRRLIVTGKWKQRETSFALA